MTKKISRIQIATEIVRDTDLKPLEFVLYARLVNYHTFTDEIEMEIDHSKLKGILRIRDNDTLKKSYNKLYEKGYMLNKLDKLPRKGSTLMIINEKYIPKNQNVKWFTQFASDVVSPNIIDAIGYTGIRMLYVYQSHINYTNLNRQYSFASEETIAKESGVTKNTVIKHNATLKKHKFIKIEKHKLEDTGEWEVKKGNVNESLKFTKYNNHVYLSEENVRLYIKKKVSALA
ncbi:hypothetical protein [Priestia megaterium]|uniref:hypothetical protein n=1 Tax=Priestia megaterium TaxID=1404 RepID=UPI002D802B05|nr:hypothetical protein [Priestia megaterium]MEB4860619.1 hypothetical protein [Priestia megaterium]